MLVSTLVLTWLRGDFYIWLIHLHYPVLKTGSLLFSRNCASNLIHLDLEPGIGATFIDSLCPRL